MSNNLNYTLQNDRESTTVIKSATCIEIEKLRAENQSLKSQVAELERRAGLWDFMTTNRLGVWWSSYHQKWIMQKPNQVVGKIASGSTLEEAIDQAMKGPN